MAQSSRRIAAVLLSVGTLLAASECVAATTNSMSPSLQPSCQPTANGMVPPQEVMDFFVAGMSPLPSFGSREEWATGSNWQGNDTLWVGLPTGGVIRANREPFSLKIPAYRLAPGSLTISGSRLDGQSGPASGESSTDSLGPGFVATRIDLPKAGCWQLSYALNGRRIEFVLRVDPP